MSQNRKKTDNRPLISGKTYNDQVVEIDSFRYKDCHFKKCRLLYKGLNPPDIVNCKIETDCALTLIGNANEAIRLVKLFESMAKHHQELQNIRNKG